MKNNVVITYIKAGVEKIANLSKLKELNEDLFDEGYEIDFNKISLIFKKNKKKEIGFKKDIELVYIKNAIFTGTNIFNNENNNIVIILENCIFDCEEINFERGNYQIINPIFRVKSKNKIKIYNCNDVEINGNNKTNINYIESKLVTNLTLSSINEIEKIKVISDDKSKVKLQNINNINDYSINSGSIEINSCKFDFSNLYHNTLYSKELVLKNSNILTDKLILLSNYIYLDNSIITIKSPNNESDKYDYMKFNSFKFPDLEELTLKNSYIKTHKSIIFINLKKLDLDNSSYIETSGKIKIGDYSYKNEVNENFILNKDILQSKSFMRKYLINNLKELNKQYKNEIEKSIIKLERTFDEQIEKEKQDILKVLEKKRVKTKMRVNEYQNNVLYETKVGQF